MNKREETIRGFLCLLALAAIIIVTGIIAMHM
jgi:hypothetical protein